MCEIVYFKMARPVMKPKYAREIYYSKISIMLPNIPFAMCQQIGVCTDIRKNILLDN